MYKGAKKTSLKPFSFKPYLIISIILIIPFLLSYLYLLYLKYTQSDSINYDQNVIPKTSILVGDIKVYVDVARTPEEKQQGLSGKESLKNDEGMLFVFENKTYPIFWMIDMKFPIDIIWIADGKVVYIHENVPAPAPGTPNSELPLFRPPVGVDYVLEVNAGFSDKYNLNPEDNVDFSDIM